MRFTLKNPCSLQYIDYQNVKKTEFLGCQSQEIILIFADKKGRAFGPGFFYQPFYKNITTLEGGLQGQINSIIIKQNARIQAY